MDLLSFIRIADPTKVRVGERQRAKDEPKLLDTTIGCVVPLLPVAPAHGESELEDSLDKLFDERGSDDQAEQGDSAIGCQGVCIQFVSKAIEPSHPAKKLRVDHNASIGPSIVGKSKSMLQRLLAGVVLNPEVGIATLPTLPFVTSSVFATPEQEGANVTEAEVDSVVRSSAHVIATITTVTATVDAATVPKEAPIKPSLFGAASSASRTDSTPGGFSDVSGSKFLIGGIHTIVNPDFDLQKVYVPQWSITNGPRLDDGRVSARQISLSAEVRMRAEYNIKEKKRLRSVVDEQTELLKAIRLRTEASKFEAIEKSLQEEVRVLKDHNTTLEKEKSELDMKVADLVALVKVREQEAADLDAMVTSIKSQNDNLIDQVHRLETSSARLQEKVTVYEDYMSQLNKFQDERMEVMYEKFNKLHADFIEMALHLEKKLYPRLLTTIVVSLSSSLPFDLRKRPIETFRPSCFFPTVASCITDIKSVLTLKALKRFCETYHIPDDVHPQLPSPNQTIHEMPTGKIAKVSHFEILCRVHGFEPTNTSKNVLKAPFPKSSQYNVEHYATLVAYPAPFHKYPEPFLCLVGISHNYTLDEDTYPQFLHENGEEMDLLSFIRTADPTKVRVSERQRAEDEPKMLDTIVGRVVPLLPVAPAHGESELKDSVDKIFNEEGSDDQAKQGDSASGGQGVGIQFISKVAEVIVKDVAPLQPRRQKKQKIVVVDAGEPSHPTKKLRDDHNASTGPSFAGKSRFVISSDSSHHSCANVAEAEVNYVVKSFAPVIATITIITATINAATVAKQAPIKPSLFGAGSSSAGGTDPTPGCFSDVSGSEFLIGGIRTVVDPDFDLQKVYVLQWSVTNGSRLDDGRVCREMLDEFAPQNFLASIHGMEHDQLFTEFNVRAARQISLSAEVRIRAEYNIKEKKRLRSVVDEQTELLKVRDGEIENLKAQLLLKEAEAAEAIRLHAEASKFEAIEKSLQDKVRVLKDHNTTLEKEKSELDVKVADLVASVKVREQEAADLDAIDERMEVMYEKFNKLHADFIEMALHLEEKFYPRLLTTIANTSKSMSKDPFPKSSQYNAEHYATLVAYPAPFHKYPEPFLCLVGISHEPKLLDTTVRHVVPLLPVVPTHGESKLEDSVDKLFDEGGSDDQAEQGDSASGGQGIGIQFVSEAAKPSHPSKKLRDDHNASTRLSVAGESRFVISSDPSHHSGANVVEAEVDSVARSSASLIATITTVTATVDAATVAKEAPIKKPSLFGAGSSSAGGTDPTPGGFSDVSGSEFLIGGICIVVDPNFDLQKVYVPKWSITNGSRLDDGRVCREMLDEFAPLKFFASIRGMEHDRLFIEFNVGAARQISLSVKVRMRAEYNIKEKKRLRSVVDEQTELLKVRDGEIENLKAQLLLKEAEAAKAIHHNTTLEKEKSELDVKVADLVASVKVREQEAADLDVMVTSVKSQNDNLIDQVHRLETSSAGLQEKVTVYEDRMSQLEKFQDDQMEVVYEKFNKLHADFIEMAFHLEEKLYPHLLTTNAGRRWLLTYGMKLVVAKCLNSPEYLSALGAVISKAIEKGMQDGLASGITHGQEGRVLTDVVAFNPSTESDYISALQDLQSVNFSLLADLKSNKDASLETLMDILLLDETLAERLDLNESQPHVDQLMVPVYHSPDQTVIGARALSLSLDVSHSRVQRIKENIANNRPALRDVFVSLAEPLSIVALEGTEGTSGTAPDTTTALSTTYVSASSIPPIFTYNYVVVHADSQ
ncbi:hypothetical protein Tco_0683267 [Tanacetum coccineum]|uniref:Transposase (Putative), gypsy type n=1 Tax=Tanacetum coccineum TaxID=301880 RepID=A0ABQ4XTM6_9ASTR